MAKGLATAEIQYEDAEGRLSTRMITILEVANWLDDVALQSFCHLRQGRRTFLVSRIKQMVDPATGEVIENPIPWINERYFETPEGRHDKVLSECSTEISIMVFVARADGRMMPAERAIIVKYLLQRCSDLDLDPDFLDEATRSFEVREWDFNRAVTQLKLKPEPTRKSVMAAARAIVATDKTVRPAEQEALDKLAAKLGV
jgi:hypothetical protein